MPSDDFNQELSSEQEVKDFCELNYDLDSDVSEKAGPKDLAAVRKMADEIGIQISGLCSFLFWPYPLTSSDPEKSRTTRRRARGPRARWWW